MKPFAQILGNLDKKLHLLWVLLRCNLKFNLIGSLRIYINKFNLIGNSRIDINFYRLTLRKSKST